MKSVVGILDSGREVLFGRESLLVVHEERQMGLDVARSRFTAVLGFLLAVPATSELVPALFRNAIAAMECNVVSAACWNIF